MADYSFVLNGYFISNNKEQLQINILISEFYANFHKYDDVCKKVFEDIELDADFQDLL